MAEEDKTPETEAQTPDSIQEEVETAASEEGAGDTSTVDAPAPAAATPPPSEPQEVLEPKERRARRRAAKQPAARGPVTPEQRDEERRARRAQKAKLRRAYRLRERTKAAEKRAAEPTPEPGHAPEHGPGRAKVRQGIVVSDKADKTIVVRVDVTRRHRRYGKIMRTSSKIHAHDERNDAGAGDTVRVVECRPMSRTKRWRLTDVLEKAK
jgi:small subunit ribosomal protein S17